MFLLQDPPPSVGTDGVDLSLRKVRRGTEDTGTVLVRVTLNREGLSLRWNPSSVSEEETVRDKDLGRSRVTSTTLHVPNESLRRREKY